MLKADDNEITNSVEELPKSQPYSTHPSTQSKETIIFQQQHPSPPTPSPTKTSQFDKNPFQIHPKLKIISNEKKEDLNLQYLTTLNGVLKLVEIVSIIIIYLKNI